MHTLPPSAVVLNWQRARTVRVPIGAPARAVLAVRRAVPDDVPFVPGQPG